MLFLERSASVYPDKAACIYNGGVTTYAQFYERVRRHAAALQSVGVEAGDRIAYLLPNLPSMLEANFAPMGIGAVLVALNIRLSAREIAYILNHSGAKILVFDSELADTVRQLRGDCPGVETYVQVRDTAPLATDIPSLEYEQWLASVGTPVRAARHSLRNRHPDHQLHLRHHRHAQGRGVHAARSLP